MRQVMAILVALAMAVGGAWAQEPVAVGPEDARAIARQALAEGKPALADAIATALLARDARDADALMVRALLLRAEGRFDEARRNASAAWRYAQTPALRFDAAMLTAELLTRQERFTRAQFWLRRADQAAEDDARRAAAAQAFNTVRQRNPLTVNLRFALKPSNNVNNGAETLEVVVGGLPFRLDTSGQQLGGWEGSVGLGFGYRLSESRTQRTEALGEVSFRKVWLDSDAATLAPTARDSDFDYGVIVGGLRHQRLIWPELGISSVTGILGQSWYGGDTLARWAEVQLGQGFRQSDTGTLNFGVQARLEKRLDDGINDNRSLGLSLEYVKNLGDGAGFSIGAFARNVWSDSATIDSRILGVSGSRAFGRIGAVEPRLGLIAETRDFDKWVITAGGREDRTLSLKLDVAWPDISYYGFVPLATLTARRTWSDVDIYDRNELSLGLTAISRF